MKKWKTRIKAIDPKTGELKEWAGPVIESLTIQGAKKYCQENELGYCEIVGELLETGTIKLLNLLN